MRIETSYNDIAIIKLQSFNVFDVLRPHTANKRK